MIVLLIAGLIKRTESNECIKMSQYFPKSYEPFGGVIKVRVDLNNYPKQRDIKKSFTCWYFKFCVRIKFS